MSNKLVIDAVVDGVSENHVIPVNNIHQLVFERDLTLAVLMVDPQSNPSGFVCCQELMILFFMYGNISAVFVLLAAGFTNIC